MSGALSHTLCVPRYLTITITPFGAFHTDLSGVQNKHPVDVFSAPTEAERRRTRFFPSIHLSHLLHMIPCSYRASSCFADLPSCTALYAVSVRQTRGLPVG